MFAAESQGDLFNPFTEQSAGRYFVGREEQLKQFERALSGLKADQPRHLFVAGLHGTGKTSYLSKLVEISRGNQVLAVLTTLDPAATARQQMANTMRAVVAEVDTNLRQATEGSALPVLSDWDSGEASNYFRVPRGSDRLHGDDMKADFEFLQTILRNTGLPQVVICVDEGQRIEPFALSALKNALQHLHSYLIILSLRLADDKPSAEDTGRQLLDEKARQAEDDYGASRFYVSGVPLGSFASEQEARACLLKRLDGNSITFPSDVLSQIARITGRLPAALIALASDVYELTADSGQPSASPAILDKAFKRRYAARYAEALTLSGNLSDGDVAALKALLEYDRPVTAMELASHIYPNAPAVASGALADGIEKALTRACPSLFCNSNEGQFVIEDPVRRHALEMVLASA